MSERERRDERGLLSNRPFAKLAFFQKLLQFPSPRQGPSPLRLSQGLQSEVVSRYTRDSIGSEASHKNASSQQIDTVIGLLTH